MAEKKIRTGEMTGILFTGGEAPESYRSVRSYLEDADLICAADSGIYHAERYGLKPHFLVGDMDSVKNAEDIKKHDYAEIIQYSRDKDYTDTELGFSLLKEKGCDKVVIIGGGGGRTDHLLAIYSMFRRVPHPDLWIMKSETVTAVDDKISFRAEKGENLSFFPVSEGITRMKSSGLVWELDNLVWKPGDAGVSNRASGTVVSVEIVSGRLVMVRKLQ